MTEICQKCDIMKTNKINGREKKTHGVSSVGSTLTLPPKCLGNIVADLVHTYYNTT